MKVPCRGCTDRTVRCHTYCERYLAFRKEQEEVNKMKAENAELNRFLFENRDKVKRMVIK